MEICCSLLGEALSTQDQVMATRGCWLWSLSGRLNEAWRRALFMTFILPLQSPSWMGRRGRRASLWCGSEPISRACMCQGPGLRSFWWEDAL